MSAYSTDDVGDVRLAKLVALSRRGEECGRKVPGFSE